MHKIMNFKKNGHIWLLLLIFTAVFASRLIFAFQSPFFSLDDSYYVLRQVEEIDESGKPLIYDDLSYQGRFHSEIPLYYYILGFFNLFLPAWVIGKIIPNLFASLLIFIIYLISYDLTKKKDLSLFGALLSGFVPLFYSKTFNSLSFSNLMLPLMFLLIYFTIKNKPKNTIIAFVILSILACMISPVSSLLVAGYLMFILLVKLNKKKLSRNRFEMIVFYCSAFIFVHIVFFQRSLREYGYKIFWQNIPTQMLESYFSEITLIGGIMGVGIIAALFGGYVIYRYVASSKNEKILMLVGFAISTTFLIWLRLVEPAIGLMYISVTMVVFFILFIKEMPQIIGETKFDKFKYLIGFAIAISFLLSFFIPSFAYSQTELKEVPEKNDVNSLINGKEKVPEGDTILGRLSEGNMISFYTGRKNFVDTRFLLAPEPEKRLDIEEDIYTSNFETAVVRSMVENNLDFVFVSDKTRKIYDENLFKFSESECFEEVNSRLYKLTCKIRSVKKNE